MRPFASVCFCRGVRPFASVFSPGGASVCIRFHKNINREQIYYTTHSGLGVKQPTANLQVSYSNPSPPIAAPAPTKAGHPGLEPPTSKPAVGCTTIAPLLILTDVALPNA